MSAERDPEVTAWARPGGVRGASAWRHLGRWGGQLFRPPRGHRTRITPTGWVLILLALAIGVSAFNTSQNILYLGLSLLLGSLLLSGVMSWMNFFGCQWRLRTDPHGRVGESFPIAVELVNGKRFFPTYGLTADVLFGAGDSRCRLVLEGRLLPRASQRLEWLIQPSKRGEQLVDLAEISSRFPFGFLDKAIAGQCARPVLIWPARVNYHLELSRTSHAHQSGDWKTRQGSGSELINLRDYRAGDSMRMMHWKASARAGRLQVRETAEEASCMLALVLETDEARWTEAQVDHLASLAGTLAEDLFIEHRLGGVYINGEGGHALARLADLHAVLDQLATLGTVAQPVITVETRPWLPLRFRPSLTGVEILLRGEVVGEG